MGEVDSERERTPHHPASLAHLTLQGSKEGALLVMYEWSFLISLLQRRRRRRQWATFGPRISPLVYTSRVSSFFFWATSFLSAAGFHYSLKHARHTLLLCVPMPGSLKLSSSRLRLLSIQKLNVVLLKDSQSTKWRLDNQYTLNLLAINLGEKLL